MGIDSVLTANDVSGFLACDTRGSPAEKIFDSGLSPGDYLRHILMRLMAVVFVGYHVNLKSDAAGPREVLKSLIVT